MKDMFVIETHNLTKSYGMVDAVRSLDLQIPRNAIVGFLGPNGAGKSTTIKLLLGLIQPTAGGGSIFGMDIIRDSFEIRRRVGYLAQHPYGANTPSESKFGQAALRSQLNEAFAPYEVFGDERIAPPCFGWGDSSTPLFFYELFCTTSGR